MEEIRPELIIAVRDSAQLLTGAPQDYDALLSSIGEARFVLLGEASHGTHEFYRERARLTRRLIEEEGFTAVAVEADWPDAFRVSRYVLGESDDADAADALGGFLRFPAWMWRNADALDFVGWLRAWNEGRPAEVRAGFYGLDLYSLYASIEEVIRYLEGVDPEAAQRARERYACFEPHGRDPHRYGEAASFGGESCEQEMIQQLSELQRRAAAYLAGDGRAAEDAFFHAEQNARLAKDAEAYYRAMFRAPVESWNLRDRHMAGTLDELARHLERQRGGRPARIVVWAHNSHLGDARATEMGDGGELNLGQLVRERYGEDAFLVGFTTYEGSVTAASDWDGPAEHKPVRPALAGSYEELFHRVELPRFLLPLRDLGEAAAGLAEPRLERAIGVVYRPQTERFSHYFEARLARQFDAVLHFDFTRAVEPLERTGLWRPPEPPETFPTGI